MIVQAVALHTLFKIERATPGAAGYDVRARLDKPVTLFNGEIRKIPTGLHLALPENIAVFVAPRSGLAANGISIANAPGVVDEDYRGEICVLLENRGDKAFTINPGERVGQILFMPVIHPEIKWFANPAELGETERGQNSFGSTGVK